MSSVDVFSSSGSTIETQSTQNYNYLIMFVWDPEVYDPFQLFVRTKRSMDEVPDNWLVKTLVNSGRLQKRQLKCMDNEVYSVFAKMERGK